MKHHASKIQPLATEPGASPRNNVISFLDESARCHPDRIALIWSEAPKSTGAEANRGGETLRQMTFGELNNHVRAAAAGFAQLGIRHGDRIFLFVPMSPQLYIAMFGVQTLGASAVFLDSWARAPQVANCMRLIEPKAIVAPEKAYRYAASSSDIPMPSLKIVVGHHKGSYAASLESLAAREDRAPICPVEQEHTALITFTTGSSGVPKGADRTHRFLAAQHQAIDRHLPYEPEDRDLPVFPIFSLNNMAGGVTTVLPRIDLAQPNKQDGAALFRQIRTLGVTCCTLSPSLLRGLAEHARRQGAALPGLRRVATGGAPISSRDVAAVRLAAPNARIVILYGSTEVEPIAQQEATTMPAERGQEGVCVGQLCHGLRAKFLRVHRGPITLDSNGFAPWEVPQGEVGELVLTGEHVCRGYYRNAEAVAATKIVEPDGTLWHRTGDLCRRDPNKRIWIVGRVHNAIQRKGQLLFPVRAEVIMNQLKCVAGAAYLGLPDPVLGERAVAVFTPRQTNHDNDLREQVRNALQAEGVVVDDVRQVDSIPLDPRHNSKVEYDVLRNHLMGKA